MWKILGEDAIYIDIPETWKRRMIALAGEGEKKRFDIIQRVRSIREHGVGKGDQS